MTETNPIPASIRLAAKTKTLSAGVATIAKLVKAPGHQPQHIEALEVLPIGGGAQIRATDGTIHVSTFVACTCSDGGQVPAALFANVVAACDGEDVTIIPDFDGEDTRTLVTSAGMSHSIRHAMAACPPMAPVGEGFRIQLPAAQLAAMLKRVSMYVSTDKTRTYLSGICLRQRDGGVDLLSTNGHVMAHDRIPSTPDGFRETVMSSEFARAVIGLIGDKAKGEAALNVGADQIQLEYAGSTVQCATAKIEYIDALRAVPTGDGGLVTADVAASDLIKALKRVSTSLKTGKTRHASIDLSTDAASFVAAVPSGPELHLSIPAVCRDAAGEHSGYPRLNFNVEYMLSIASHFEGRILIELRPGGSPLILRSDAAPFRFLLMPMAS